jgi:hypothetical protein
MVPVEIDRVGKPDYFHVFLNRGSARHNSLFLVAGSQPDLTIQAFPVPTKITVRDAFCCEVLKAPEQRIVLRNSPGFTANFYFDEPLERLKNVFYFFDIHRLVSWSLHGL